MLVNNALEPSFAGYVRLGGGLAGFSVASLLAKRTPNLTREHSLRSWPASARSPGQSSWSALHPQMRLSAALTR